MNYYHPTTLEHIRNPLPAVAEWAGATALPVPDYDPHTQQCMFVDGAWKVAAVAPCICQGACLYVRNFQELKKRPLS
jgi:hypothetical protein